MRMTAILLDVDVACAMMILNAICGLLLAYHANAQTPGSATVVPATPITPALSDTPATSNASTNTTADCSWDGSVTYV